MNTFASPAEQRRSRSLFYATTVVWYILAFVEIVLLMRLLLKMLGANPESGFATFIYGLTSLFVAPFATLFSPAVTEGAETASVFEWSTIIGMLVYALIAWGIVKIIKLRKPRDQAEIEQSLDEQ